MKMPVEWVMDDGTRGQRLFNKFAGREVPLKKGVSHEKQVGSTRFAIVGEVIADRNDPVIAEMKKIAEDNRMILRLLLSDTEVTGPENYDRVNVHIRKDSNGAHRVGYSFDMY